MKIAHIISSIDQSTGGPARSSTSLVDQLLKNVFISQIDLFSLRSISPLIENFESAKGRLHFCNSSYGGISKELGYELNQITVDLFHGHGIWDISVSQMAKIARRRNIPYVISIRGMLEPWSLQQSKFKKKVAMLLYQNRDLNKASCLHATAHMEADSIRALGYKNPIAVIPNGINLSEYPLKKVEIVSQKKRVLFLSRIHVKKGIENLIAAWEKLDISTRLNWELEIAGNGESDYIDSLNNLIKSKSLDESIRIVGSKFGDEKIRAYHDAHLFVLPTYSENFGIVIAEALACGVPVVTTNGTPWEDIKDYNAGDWIEIGVDPLVTSLEKMMKKGDLELIQMGKNGRKLIEEKYSINSVADRFFELYSWILSKDKKPEFVI
ncbi:glycosyltransferase [Sphingobacterium siyangense]|uniref:glycosyltransferase n=1 Tax=Sphingobacterium siyangense TaxID=459529 RepID=UPI0019640274|nr:glycosyltransferase [Sphingobacterium siyangense]QRY58328.1 glycosyltransferase [Sphingobacterium siyangense]